MKGTVEMKKKIITLLLLLLISVTSLLCPVGVYALENPETPPTIGLFKEQTGYIYQYLNGATWKRLWSYTYGKWLEPYWTVA